METRIESITPELAKKYLSLNKGNRNLTNKRVNFYVNQMKKGNWKLSPQGIAFDKSGNLLDGQHRLSAVVKSGITIDFVVSRGFDRDVFKVLDTGKIRSAGDVFSIEGIKNYTNTAAGVNKYMKLKKGTGYDNNNNENNISNEDILNCYYERQEMFISSHQIASEFYNKLRLLNKTDAMAYISFLKIDKGYSFSEISNFFNELNTFSENNTLNLFRERMIRDRLSTNKLKSKIKRALFIKTWNSYILNKEYKVLKFDEKREEYPEFI